MSDTVDRFKNDLEQQLEELANSIRTLENELLLAKEKYLKVQGAIEILGIVKEADKPEE